MLNLKTKKTVNERVMELQSESKGIVSTFTAMINRLKEVNEEIEANKEAMVEDRDNLNYCIKEMENQLERNNAIKEKIENILS